MKKNVYLVISKDCAGEDSFNGNVYPENSYLAFALSVPACNNLVSELSRISGIMTANVCASRKEAEEIAEDWNWQYRQNGTYCFDKRATA